MYIYFVTVRNGVKNVYKICDAFKIFVVRLRKFKQIVKWLTFGFEKIIRLLVGKKNCSIPTKLPAH